MPLAFFRSITQLQTHHDQKNIEFRILGVGNLEFTNRSLGEWFLVLCSPIKSKKKTCKKGWESSLHPLKWKACKLQNQPPTLQRRSSWTSKDLLNHHSKRWKMYANFRGRRRRFFKILPSALEPAPSTDLDPASWPPQLENDQCLEVLFTDFCPKKDVFFARPQAKGD